jgi:DNA-binding MarR family transcriptional regulator
MKTKRKGVKINCLTFRVLPDPVVDLWREGKLHNTSVKVWVMMQRLAHAHKDEITFTAIWRYCGVARATLAKALKQLMEHGLIRQDGQTYTVVFSVDYLLGRESEHHAR